MNTQHYAGLGERRQHQRLSRDEKLLIQVSRCDSKPELVGTTVLCAMIDVSINGVKLRTKLPILEGIELDLWVNVDSCGDRYCLIGSVQWSLPEAGEYLSGIELRDLDNTDIRSWRDLFI
jgi:hypothetical protein